MSIDSYRNEIDRFCDENYNVSSEEMLIMAKKGLTGADIRRRKIRTRRIAGLAAAFVAVSAMTVTAAAGAAGHGPMSFIYSHYIKDPATTELVDEGYYFTVTDPEEAIVSGASVAGFAGFGEKIETKFISTELIGVAGDTQQPKILLDARINDNNFAKKYDHFFIVTKTIGAEVYDQGLDGNYGPSYGFAVKDEKDPTLYHISVDAPVAWVTGGETTVFTIESLKGYSSAQMKEYNVSERDVEDYWNHAQRNAVENMHFEEVDILDISYRFVVPDNVFKPAVEKRYQDMTFVNDGVSYTFDYAQFGAYETRMTAYIEGIDPSLTYEDSGYEYDNATELGRKLVLTVDGTEYKPHLGDNSTALPWCDKDGVTERGVADAWYVCYNFDAIDFEHAKEVKLQSDGKRYVLKGESSDSDDAGSSRQDTETGRPEGNKKTISTDKFDLTLVGVSGSKDSPMIKVDLKVKDTAVASKYDIFFITGRTIGEEVYDSDKRENYGFDHGFGERDTVDPSLYHLSIPGASAWMSDDQVTVFEIASVTAYSSSINARYGLTQQDLIDSWQYANPLSDEKMNGINAFEKYDIGKEIRFIAY